MGTRIFSWNWSDSQDVGRKPGAPPVVLIAGATASGKSGLAVALAQNWRDQGQDSVVVNADSAQVYSDLQILSARPDTFEMHGIEHRLFGHVDGAHAYSAPRWASEAKQEISSAHNAGKVPILVGGTGLYMRTLLDGIAPIPDIDPDIREQVRSLPVDRAYTALVKDDPLGAATLAPTDTTRIARALEVVRSTGTPIAKWRETKVGGIASQIDLNALVLLPPREWLYARCDQRFTQMMGRGATEEVEALLARNLDPSLPVMRAIGVPEIAALIRGESNRDEAIIAGQMATRRYAKRQYTWFRNQSPSSWSRLTEPVNNVNIRDIEILFHK